MTKILLVEDDKSLREIYGVRLLAEGYDIVSAGDGEEALAMAIKERPQLIVSDVMMPKISGFDMLDILRSTTETRDIKVIMMTALSSDDQRARGEQLGADRYLVKSQVGIEDVVRTVHEVLGDLPSATPTQALHSMQQTPVPTPSDRSNVLPPTRPATPTPVAPVSAPAPQATPAPQPATPQPAPTPVAVAPASDLPPTPAPQPVAPGFTPQPAQAAQTPQPAPLPQPTAPFSTNRPANLGDRIIQPLSGETSEPDVSALIAQELGAIAPTPETPSVPPQPTPPEQPTAG